MALRWSVVEDGVATSEEFDEKVAGASAAMESLRENLDRWSHALVQVEVVNRTMAGDEAEAIADATWT
jgi:hypothetical protein